MKPIRLKTAYRVLLLVTLSLLVYYPTLFAPLNSLDDQVFTNLLMNREGFNFTRHFIPAGAPEYYRPLLTLTFEVDKLVGGLQETFMHLVNILLHALNVVLVFFVARLFQRFLAWDDSWVPFCAAALFALHPLNTEAVNWIAGRTDLLAGSFVFASLLCLLQALARRSLVWGWGSTLLLLGGALCKETALFMVPGALLILFWRGRDYHPAWNGRWFLTWMMAGAIVAYSGLRFWGMRYDRGVSQAIHVFNDISARVPSSDVAVGSVAVIGFSNLADAAWLVFKTTGFYSVKLFQPFPLNFAIHRIHDLYFFPGLLVVVSLVLLLFRRRPVDTLFLLSAGIGSSALLAVFTGVAWTPIAERYMYIPSGPFLIAFLFAVAPWIDRLRMKNAAMGLFLFLLLGAAGTTAARNFIWQDNLTLYQDTARKSPDFAPAKAELVRALYSHNLPEEASSLALSFSGTSNQASTLNRAVALARQGEYDEARAYLRDQIAKHNALERRALDMLVKITSEMVERTDDEHVRRQYFLEMVEWLSRLIALSNDPFQWYRLGRIQLWLGNREDARNSFAAAARLLPADSLYLEPSRKLAEDLSQ